MSDGLTSVGVDVGTTTTQLIVSRLQVQNQAGAFAVPEMVITSIVAALSYKPLKRYWLGEDLKSLKAA